MLQGVLLEITAHGGFAPRLSRLAGAASAINFPLRAAGGRRCSKRLVGSFWRERWMAVGCPYILIASRTHLFAPGFPSLSILIFYGLAGILSPKSRQIDRKWDSPFQLRTRLLNEVANHRG